MKINKFFLYYALSTMIILPILFIVMERWAFGANKGLIMLTGKWFIFWAIGVRQLTAGIRQIMKPSFTAETIFHITDKRSFVIVTELGFANICFGLLGIVTIFISQWRIVSAFSSGLFFGLTGVNHLIRRPVNLNEVIPTITNLFVFLIIAGYIVGYFLTGN